MYVNVKWFCKSRFTKCFVLNIHANEFLLNCIVSINIICVCMCVCMCFCMRFCMRSCMYVCMYVCISACMCVPACMRGRTRACMYSTTTIQSNLFHLSYIYTIILHKSVCLSAFANCRSQLLLDRLGRCL